MSKVTLKVGEEFEPITKDNIAEVLEYNGVSRSWFSLSKNCISYHWTSTNNIAVYSSSMYFNNPKWLEHLEVEFGKLKPLPKKVNPFDAVKIGQWVRYVGEDAFDTTKNRWYQRISRTRNWFVYKTDDDSTVHTTEYEEWDLTDIRDYNPDEEIILKVGDAYIINGIFEDTIKQFDYINNRIVGNFRSSDFKSFSLEHGITSVNGRQGKYVIPPFDFVQTLLDNGFQAFGFFICNNTRVSTSPLWFDTITSKFNDSEIKLTPANAKRIIDAAKILNGLE